VWKVIIIIHILLGVNFYHGSWTLENIIFEFVRIFSFKDFIIFLNQIRLIQTSKCHLVLHRHWFTWNFIMFDWYLLFLFRRSNLWTSWLLRMIWMIKIGWNWWHRNWRNAVWSMNHASSNTLLMSVVSSLLWRFSILGLMLEIKEATVSISMGLCLHHLECLFILVTFSMHWTSPYHQLLTLMMSLTLHILLVLHILIMIILLFLMHDHLHMLVKLHVLWIHWSLLLILLGFIRAIDQMRFNSEIFLMDNFVLCWFER